MPAGWICTDSARCTVKHRIWCTEKPNIKHKLLCCWWWCQSEFERLSKTRLSSRRPRAAAADAATTSSSDAEPVRRRHAGVIGLSACVLSAPYHVPAFMPAVLMTLSTHVDDPQPIQVVISAEHSNSGRKSFDSILATRSIFFHSIRQSDKFAACTLIFK